MTGHGQRLPRRSRRVPVRGFRGVPRPSTFSGVVCVVTEWSRYGVPAPSPPLRSSPVSSSSYQGRHYGGRHRVQTRRARLPRAFSSSFVLPTAAAAALVVTATGATVVADAATPLDPRPRAAARPRWPAPSRSPTRPWSPTSRQRRQAASMQTAALAGPRRGGSPRRPHAQRKAAAEGQGRARGQALGAPDPHLAHHLRLRLALGQDPRRHRPRRPHRHPDLRDVQGRRHRLVLRLELRQQGRDPATGTARSPGTAT